MVVLYHATPEEMKEANKTDKARKTKKNGLETIISAEAYISKLEHFVSLSVSMWYSDNKL